MKISLLKFLASSYFCEVQWHVFWYQICNLNLSSYYVVSFFSLIVYDTNIRRINLLRKLFWGLWLLCPIDICVNNIFRILKDGNVMVLHTLHNLIICDCPSDKMKILMSLISLPSEIRTHPKKGV